MVKLKFRFNLKNDGCAEFNFLCTNDECLIMKWQALCYYM